MKYAIFEDEPYSRDGLLIAMKEICPEAELIHMGESVTDAIEFFSSPKSAGLDFVLLDIELSDGNCFDIFEDIEIKSPIIFTTAYNEYALDAFDVNGIAYLLKPIQPKALEKALGKLKTLHGGSATESCDLSLLRNELQERRNLNRVLTISGDKYSFSRLDDIAYFLSEENYVFAYQKNGDSKMTSYTNLRALADILDPVKYYQISRNIIASIDSIVSVTKFFRGRLMIKIQAGNNCREVIMSAKRRDDFLRWLGM